MPRDMQLILQLLTYVAKEDKSYIGSIPIPEYEQHPEDKVLHHLRLCEEAGYLELDKGRQNAEIPKRIVRMTWAGYEALDKAQD